METILAIIGALLLIPSIIVVRSLTTLFHELGHALPSLAFTNKPVKVFIGTYGNENHGIKLHLKRLQIFFRFNLLNWNIGLCSHERVEGFWKNLIIILGGPIASLLLSIPLIFIIGFYDLSDLSRLLLMIFILAALFDFLVNMIPMSGAVVLSDGITYNDGAQLFHLIMRQFASKEALALEQLFNAKKYDKVIDKSMELIANGQTEIDIYNLLIKAFIETKQYENALETYTYYKAEYTLGNSDYYQIAMIYFKLENHTEALKYINHCLYKDYNNVDLLMKRGYIYLQQKELDKAFFDLNQCLKNGVENTTLFHYLGLYYQKTNKIEMANKYFELEKSL